MNLFVDSYFMCISYLLQYITHDPLFVFVQLYNTYCIWLMNWKSFHIPHSLESLPCLESVLAAWMNVLSALYLRRTEVFFSSQTSTWKRLRYWCTKIKSLIIYNAVTSLWINGSCAPLLPRCVCVHIYVFVCGSWGGEVAQIMWCQSQVHLLMSYLVVSI